MESWFISRYYTGMYKEGWANLLRNLHQERWFVAEI
jgi:hypothetical protein